MTDNETNNGGLGFAFTMDEAQEALAKISTMTKADKRICKCGHAARFHASESSRKELQQLAASGRNTCTPGRQMCPCDKFAAVMIAQDVRRFMARTDGPGPLHALAKGALTTWKMGQTATWLDGVTCDLCHKGGIHITPIAYTDYGTEANWPTKHNLLVCADCRTRVANQPRGAVE